MVTRPGLTGQANATPKVGLYCATWRITEKIGRASGNSGDDEMTPKKCEEFQDTAKVRRASGKVGETPRKGAGSPIFFGDPEYRTREKAFYALAGPIHERATSH